MQIDKFVMNKYQSPESFKEIDIRGSYRTPFDDISNEFLIPVLMSSKKYCRATGFFTSESLARLSDGIGPFASRGGLIRIITSPKLRSDDLEAISKGYDIKEIINNSILREIEECKGNFPEERLNLLANLVANGTLEFKIAFMETNSSIEIFHSKFGIFEDYHGNKVGFTGSMNETGMGLKGNFERIHVFNSWEDLKRIKWDQELFDSLWNDNEPEVRVLDFPKAARDKLKELFLSPTGYKTTDKCINGSFQKPNEIELRDYQLKAIDAWEANSFRGIFNMATGTGKTITALSALDRLYKVKGHGIVTIIVCPLKHLVEQWADNIRKFGIEPIVGHSTSKHKDWKTRLDNKIRLMNIEEKPNDNFYLITTNSSYFSDDVQNILKQNKSKTVLVVDEVHNIGKRAIENSLDGEIEFRLGLSATVERYKDRKGTDSILDYFDGICIEYGLEEAISENMLVPYYYHPILCYMTEDEYDEFTAINHEIEEIENSNIDPILKLAEMRDLEIRGARLMARMKDKFDNLRLIADSIKHESHILVYCGATKLWDEDEDALFDDGLRAIDKATSILGGELRIRASQFTYKEDVVERKEIIEDFSNGVIQVLIAIRCLDEGVDIPAIRTALLLSSSDNPKEYIQRRGRVLRRYPSKEYATIFDFIALPKPIHGEDYNNQEIKSNEIKYLSREIKRMMVFSDLCLNPEETDGLIDDLESFYDVPDLRGYVHGN